MKRKLMPLFVSGLALLIVGCATTSSSSAESSDSEGSSQEVVEVSQGVTATKIKVGNTAATSGALAGVGVPFNAAMEAVFDEVNADGGVRGREIEFVHYDDTFNAALGLQYTERLVEEDEVFALVGHFGTPTVGATIDYILDQGIPMVYAATGINALYFQRTEGNPVMPVQPIYKTEGRMLFARAIKEADLFGTVDKVGVIYTTDDAGLSIKAGIDAQALLTSGVTVQAVAASGDYSAQVLALKDGGVDVVLVATNQAFFPGILDAMAAGSLEVPVLTSYVSASPYYIKNASVSETRPVYTNAWVDVFSESAADELAAFGATIDASTKIAEADKAAIKLNSFAIAGYIAAKIFVEGLLRVAEDTQSLTWDRYIAAMESAPVDFPLGGEIDFTNGKRWGVDQLSLLKYDKATSVLVASKPVESLEEILDK